MSPEGDTQHYQVVGRGGRRTGKGTLEKYLLLKKFTSVDYDRGGNGKKGMSLWHYNISKTKLRNYCQVTQTFLPCSTRLSLSVNA